MTTASPPSPDHGVRHTAPENKDSIAAILVVDDDPVVKHLLEVCLPRLGFTVWSVASGKAALSFYERHRERIDVVLLDVRMPDMDGPATFRELLRLNPEVKCCFMSGYSGQYTADMLEQMGAYALIDKPFNLDDLSRTLRRIVGQGRLRKTA